MSGAVVPVQKWGKFTMPMIIVCQSSISMYNFFLHLYEAQKQASRTK